MIRVAMQLEQLEETEQLEGSSVKRIALSSKDIDNAEMQLEQLEET
jgi:hypothetical protein